MATQAEMYEKAHSWQNGTPRAKHASATDYKGHWLPQLTFEDGSVYINFNAQCYHTKGAAVRAARRWIDSDIATE